jgi:beta-glucosidase-like glycosyl hydrolase
MCSYNAETYGSGLEGNGSAAQHGAIPSCANKGLLTDLARTQWGFDGYALFSFGCVDHINWYMCSRSRKFICFGRYVTTDCGAADYVEGAHGYTSNHYETVRAVLGAGVDTDCGGLTTPSWSDAALLGLLTNATAKGVIAPMVDTSLLHLFTMRMRLGQFDPPALQPWGQYGLGVVDTSAHRALAQDAAAQGFVLLKNINRTLPLNHRAVRRVSSCLLSPCQQCLVRRRMENRTMLLRGGAV